MTQKRFRPAVRCSSLALTLGMVLSFGASAPPHASAMEPTSMPPAAVAVSLGAEVEISRLTLAPLYDAQCAWSAPSGGEAPGAYVARMQRDPSTGEVAIDLDCMDRFYPDAAATTDVFREDLVALYYANVALVLQTGPEGGCLSKGFQWLDRAADAYDVGDPRPTLGGMEVRDLLYATAAISEACGGTQRALQLYQRAFERGMIFADRRMNALMSRQRLEYRGPPSLGS